MVVQINHFIILKYYIFELQPRIFLQATGLDVNFVEDNHSKFSHGVLRGLHYQIKHPQGKLVQVTLNAVFSFTAALSYLSPNFGKWAGGELSVDNERQLWIPLGFAHGFVATDEAAEFLYKIINYCSP